MEEIRTNTHIRALCEKLNESGFEAKIWRNERIYLNGYGRDIKAYFLLFDPEDVPPDSDWALLDGVVLKVSSHGDKSAKWLLNRAKQVKHAIMLDVHACGVGAEHPCESWQEVDL